MKYKIKLLIRSVSGREYIADNIAIEILSKRELSKLDIFKSLAKNECITLEDKTVIITKHIEWFSILDIGIIE